MADTLRKTDSSTLRREKKSSDPIQRVKDFIFANPSSTTKSQTLLIFTAILGFNAIIGLLLPGVGTGFWGAGFNTQNSTTDIFRAFAIAHAVLAFLCFKSQAQKESRELILMAVGSLFVGLGIWNLFSLLVGYGIGIMVLFHLPVNLALGFLGLKQSEIIKV